MAWPLSRLTTYVANSTPVIRAPDLNALQDGIVSTVTGTWSLQGVTVTPGTPGGAVTPVPGSLVAGRTIYSATVPTPSTLSPGEHCRETPPAAVASMVGTGMGVLCRSGYGIESTIRVSAGNYAVTLQRVPSGLTVDNVAAVVSGNADTLASCSVSLDGSNRPVLSITLYAVVAGSPANLIPIDSNFFFSCWVF